MSRAPISCWFATVGMALGVGAVAGLLGMAIIWIWKSGLRGVAICVTLWIAGFAIFLLAMWLRDQGK